MATTDQAVGCQCSIPALEATAQQSDLARQVTPERMLCPPGLATTDQWEPFQCSASV